MKNKISLTLLVIAVITMSISGCLNLEGLPPESVLPLDESVERVDGVYPTMASSIGNYHVVRGKIIIPPSKEGNSNYWLIEFEDKTKLTVKGLDRSPILIGGVHRIVLLKYSSGCQVENIEFKEDFNVSNKN